MKRFPLRLSLLAASTAAIATLVACGGISDPTKGSNERVATVSGALTGTNVPANTRVALVWKVGNTGAYAVGNDVAIVNGGFTMDLSIPATNYFFSAEDSYDGLSGSGSSSGSTDPSPPPNTSTPSPGSSTSGSPGTPGSSSSSSGGASSTSGGGAPFGVSNKLAPRDAVSGQITQPLNVAVAGFVVYVDTNNNGKLDIAGPYAASTDNVIGGNRELLLAYLRDGGALDYEKLRDRSGILPHAGYNLAWQEGRWLPLNVVELKISPNAKLPRAICSGNSGPDSISEQGPSRVPTSSSSSTGGSGSTGSGTNGYPSPDDPRLHCSPDGHSFTLEPNPADCPTPPPPPVGLCGTDGEDASPMACGGMGGGGIDFNGPVPAGWPCPIDGGGSSSGSSGTPIDGGAAPDAG